VIASIKTSFVKCPVGFSDLCFSNVAKFITNNGER